MNDMRLGGIKRKKQVTTIIDEDDKNCLAQLTIVLKLNHPDSYRDGNGCISLPVCFSLVHSFAQAKERTQGLSTVLCYAVLSSQYPQPAL
jgi:hypothetical protein